VAVSNDFFSYGEAVSRAAARENERWGHVAEDEIRIDFAEVPLQDLVQPDLI